MIQESRENRLCPLIAKCLECKWGEKCRHPHDVDKWMESKLPDVGPVCYVYETYGYCPFGVACRFGSAHIRNVGENAYENLKDPAKSDSTVCRVYNILGSELRTKLWKRHYDFTLSNRIVKKVDQIVKEDLKYNRNKGVIQKKNQEGAEEEQKEDRKEEYKIGAIIDDDLIKLRASEKKTIDWKNKIYLAPLTTVHLK
jgi:tRNA-dihydrouridine synthase 3